MTAHDDRLLGTWNAFLKPQDKKPDKNLCPKCGSDDYNRMLRSDRPFIRKRYWWVMECYTCKYEEKVL